MEEALPTGTVTFLFTDIEGSTRLLEELGDAYAGLLAEHRSAVREALTSHGGVEVDTQGDAFFAAFGSARGAVAAAEDIQRSLANGPVRVRIGLHTGEAAVEQSGYVGIDVNRAARICDAAHGAQILLSQSTRDLTHAETRDLGEHRLKDLTAPQRLHQLLVEGLPREFPPPRTLDAAETNLPVQPTPLVGRDRELNEARALLARDEVRLLTLTGPAGAGKTRLAVQLAAELVDEFADGVFLVDLSSIRDAELVLPTIAQAVGAREASGTPVAQALGTFMDGKRMLLVVDNVEQVVESAPDIGRLLASSRGLEVVATSREPLRLAGEQEYPVPPLPVGQAIELFAERARAVRPTFELNGNHAVVAEICGRLDGLPLAIELAAARVKLLPPPKLLERLDRRLSLLTGGARDAPQRQQTLRAAIDWSFDLLDTTSQELFARLSVFEGGFTLEAAEAVCDATIDGLASLVDKSLLAERGAADEPRFSMLETVREYAHDQLAERGEADELGRRHASYFLAAAVEVTRAQSASAPDAEARAAELFRDLGNLRAAVGWFAAYGDVESELRLATAAFWALWTRSAVAELHRWLVSAIARGASADSATRAAALGAAALAATHRGDTAAARRYANDSLVLARELGDKGQIEWALRALSFSEDDLEVRQRLLQECEAILLELGDDVGLAWVKVQFGWTAVLERRYDVARARYEEGAALFRDRGKRWAAANAEIAAGATLVLAGRPSEAKSLVGECLRTMAELDSTESVAECLEVLAGARLGAGDGAKVATRLLGAAARIRHELGQPGEALYRETVAETERAAREELGDRYERERNAGAGLTRDEAVALALEET